MPNAIGTFAHSVKKYFFYTMPDDGTSIEKQNFDAIPKKIYQVPNISDLDKSNL